MEDAGYYAHATASVLIATVAGICSIVIFFPITLIGLGAQEAISGIQRIAAEHRKASRASSPRRSAFPE